MPSQALRDRRTIASLFAIVCAVGFYFASTVEGWLTRLTEDVLADAIFACLAFLVIDAWLFRDELKDRQTFINALVRAITKRLATPVLETTHSLRAFAYEDQYTDAIEVDVVGRPDTAWFAINREWLGGVLGRGGTVRVFMPRTTDQLALQVVVRQQRATTTLAQLKDRVKEINRLLEDLRPRGGTLEIGHTGGRPVNHSWVRVKTPDKEHAIVCPYPHRMPPAHMPQIDVVDLDADPTRRLALYLDSEIELFNGP